MVERVFQQLARDGATSSRSEALGRAGLNEAELRELPAVVLSNYLHRGIASNNHLDCLVTIVDGLMKGFRGDIDKVPCLEGQFGLQVVPSEELASSLCDIYGGLAIGMPVGAGPTTRRDSSNGQMDTLCTYQLG